MTNVGFFVEKDVGELATALIVYFEWAGTTLGHFKRTFESEEAALRYFESEPLLEVAYTEDDEGRFHTLAQRCHERRQ